MRLRSFTNNIFSRSQFLFYGIPRAGFHTFLFVYSVFALLTFCILSEGDSINFIDRSIAEWIYTMPGLRAEWCSELTKIGGGDFVKRACGISVIVLMLLQKWQYVPALFVAVFGEMELNGILQDSIGRLRPAYPDIAVIHHFSYPSGHTGAATALFGFWALFLMVEYKDKRVTPLALSVLAFLTVAVGLSRIFLLAHWFTDVIGALLFSGAWVLISFWINNQMWLRANSGARPHETEGRYGPKAADA